MSDSSNPRSDERCAESFGGEPETCESCGRSFSCGAKLSTCWCAQVELHEDARADLSERFRGCLCRDCLVKFSSGAAG